MSSKQACAIKVVGIDNRFRDGLIMWPTCVFFHFYRAMHYSAQRGIAIACRPSVRPSVTLVDQDHIGWKSWKLMARTLGPTPSLFGAQRSSTYSQGNMEKFWRDQRWGGKNGVLKHKSGNISETRKDTEKKLLWVAYRNSPSLFRTVPSRSKERW